MKVKNNKKFIVILNILLTLLIIGFLDAFIYILFSDLFSNLIYKVYLGIFSLALFPLVLYFFYKSALKKLLFELKVDESFLYYTDNDLNIKERLTDIKEIKAYENEDKTIRLVILTNYKEIEIKRMSSLTYEFIKINTKLVINKIEKTKDDIVKSKSFKEKIKENKVKIITSIIGLIISIISIILLFKLDIKIVNYILLFVCFIYGSLELYFAYLKHSNLFDDKTTKIIMTAFFSMFYQIILFVILTIIYCIEFENAFDIRLLYITVFTYPSFMIVIVILGILLMGV